MGCLELKEEQTKNDWSFMIHDDVLIGLRNEK